MARVDRDRWLALGLLLLVVGLAYLLVLHPTFTVPLRALDERIQQLAANPEDELEAKRLKRRKLQLKDCIARLESMLIPDQPA